MFYGAIRDISSHGEQQLMYDMQVVSKLGLCLAGSGYFSCK